MKRPRHGRAANLAGSSPRRRSDAPNKVLDHGDWMAACAWAANHTPANTIFLTPRASQTFKWYAGRGEVAIWKDLPQDALGIIEWWRRLVDIYGRDDHENGSWQYDSLTEIAPDRLRQLGHEYGARFLVTESSPPLGLPQVYANRSYAIYDLRVR
jgi:hypothetical protein